MSKLQTWKEKSPYEKIRSIIVNLAVVAFIVCKVLEMVDVADLRSMPSCVLLCVYYFMGILPDWKDRRSSAIVNLVFAGSFFVLCLLSLIRIFEAGI